MYILFLFDKICLYYIINGEVIDYIVYNIYEKLSSKIKLIKEYYLSFYNII